VARSLQLGVCAASRRSGKTEKLKSGVGNASLLFTQLLGQQAADRTLDDGVCLRQPLAG